MLTRYRNRRTPDLNPSLAQFTGGAIVPRVLRVLILAADDFEDTELLYPLYRLRESRRRSPSPGSAVGRSPARRATAPWSPTPGSTT